jgi:transposase
MLWIHRTGAPWRDRPERYGPVGTVSSRFYRWCRAGVWDRILCALQAEADARGEIDWDVRGGGKVGQWSGAMRALRAE